MTLETDLRAALARRASEVPPDASARLRSHDYHARVRRWRHPVAFGALAGVGGTAAAIAAVVSLGAGAAPAFAGWSAAPTTPSGDQTASADQACQARIAAMPNAPSVSGLEPVLTDTRGPFTFVIFAGTNGHETCITSPDFTSVEADTASGSGAAAAVSTGSSEGAGTAGQGGGQQTTMGGVNTGMDANPSAGQIALALQSTTSRDGNAYSFVEGRTGTGVTGVTLSLAGGSQVTASVQGGWFAAWWPGSQRATSAGVTTASGTSTQQLGSPVQSAVKGAARSGSKAGGLTTPAR